MIYYFTGFEIYIWSLLICFIVAAIAQTIWILQHKNQEAPNIVRMLLGMGITAGGSSVALFLLMLYLFPTVKIIEVNDYHSEWFVSSKWPSQLTKVYMENRSGSSLRFEAVGYGTKKYVTGHQKISIGAFVECEHTISGYNITPPNSISSKSTGEVRWFLYSESN